MTSREIAAEFVATTASRIPIGRGIRGPWMPYGQSVFREYGVYRRPRAGALNLWSAWDTPQDGTRWLLQPTATRRQARRAPAEGEATVSVARAQAIAGVSERTIYHWLTAGKVDWVRTAEGSIRIVPASLFRPPETA